MENRQKNYGSVHDTKASMMYNRFLKQYNEWLSGGPIPDTGNQDIKYFLGQQRKRLEKRGLHRDSSIELRGLLASAGFCVSLKRGGDIEGHPAGMHE